MGKKYKFRKVYFICEDNKVFAQPYEAIHCFRREEYCKTVCVQQQMLKMDNSKMMWMHDKRIPEMTPHGFYLVHESLFDEILKQWAEESE